MAMKRKKKASDKGADKDGVVTMRGRFGRVISFFDAFDVEKESKAVLEAIESAVDVDDSDAIRKATESAARLAYKAATLADVARREYRDVKERFTSAMAIWKEQAQEYLAAEKAAKRIAGQVTVQMVTDTVGILQSQPYADALADMHDAELVRDNMGNLYAMVRERMWNLRVLSGFRGTAYEQASGETRRGDDW